MTQIVAQNELELDAGSRCELRRIVLFVEGFIGDLVQLEGLAKVRANGFACSVVLLGVHRSDMAHHGKIEDAND